MPGIASATGLMSARIRPVHRPKPKSVQLSGCTKAAPFALRPFAGLFNPYPYGCSVLCNHPADCEAKEVVRRAKDTWATEGKALLLPEEMEMIRTSLMAGGGGGGGEVAGNVGGGDGCNTEATAVPEELFRKYTETDSRPPTPAPTLASGPALTNRAATQEDLPATCNPRERTTLVLDLRAANSRHHQESETFSWHALTLEPPPTPRKSEIFVSKPIPRHLSTSFFVLREVTLPLPVNKSSSRDDEGAREEADSGSERPVIIRRRGKRLRKRKCRRGSTYGQQTEVRDPLEPTVTQVSQIGDGSRRPSSNVVSTSYNVAVLPDWEALLPSFLAIGNRESPGNRTFSQNSDRLRTANAAETGDGAAPKKSPAPVASSHTMPPSFLAADILKHLCRELDRDKVEAEFSIKRRIALEEALRVKGDVSYSRGSRLTSAGLSAQNAPRIFSRQVARFELLGGQSLCGLTPLRYLSKHVCVTSGRKLIFGRIFARFNEETSQEERRVSPNDVEEALQEVVGKALTDEQRSYLRTVLGEITESLNFREWCGLCAVVERLLCPLPPKASDPPTWLEQADFEALERRLRSAGSVDSTLALLLKEIRDR
ncbi:PREDICTED: uncharacterized protein LOC106746654 [Dinoponera quadriceps]|uniref:Uncharacterized protein LOC106746654 n=1 Tax=Dinoponera quadriceps TaxID=609295 RepID=A0A6P3XKE3_DINQU|nr:PREDICTED: uncharacterized protein LOC106746654 [Dinoponera quadriceps]